MRRVALLAVVLAVLGGAAPGHAEKKTVGASTSYGGAVVTREVPGGRRGPSTGYDGNAMCTFAGVLTPANRLNITYGGTAAFSGPQVPQLTYIKCSISNEDGQSVFAEVANGGPVSSVMSGVTGWRVSPITVCVEGFAVFGPTPVTIMDLGRSCESPLF